MKIINEFLSNKDIAVIGASTNKKKFGYIVFEALRKKQFNVFPVNPHNADIEGIQCYPDIFSLPKNVRAAVFITKPEITLNVVKQICNRGVIKYLWFQQGAEDKDAIAIAEQNGMKVIHGECILMFIKSSIFPHNMHGFFRKLFGKYPK
jgi:predicted CoA-binding protein